MARRPKLTGDELPLFDLGVPDWSQEIRIRPSTLDTARTWFAKYHYSGTPGTEGATFFGAFAPDMIAMVAVGNTSNEHGIAGKFDLGRWRGNLEITRVAVHPDSPRNTATKVVAAVLRFEAGMGVDWLFSYADTGQGHHGGIYQALNAVYVGVSEARPGYLLNGEKLHPRTLVSMYGSQSRETVEELQRNGVDIVKVDDLNTAKHTYVLPIGRHAKAIRKHLAAYAKPYPKGDRIHEHRPDATHPCRGCYALARQEEADHA